MPERAMFGITAVRYAGPQVVEAMMGLLASDARRWDLRPSPARVTEVVDRQLEGDAVVSVFDDADGGLLAGPAVRVALLPEGIETLALDDEGPGRDLADLPRF